MTGTELYEALSFGTEDLSKPTEHPDRRYASHGPTPKRRDAFVLRPYKKVELS